MPYTAQLAEKTQRLAALLAPFAAPAPQVFPSPESGYRMRAEFRIWHENEQISYAMFASGQKASGASLIKLTQFQAAHSSINALMPRLLERLSGCPSLKTRLYQCEFLATLSGEMLVTLIYHRKLDDDWQTAARALEHEFNIHIIGRSKGQKIVLSQDFVTEQLTENGQTFAYRQYEGSFTQPNAIVCQAMLAWACQQAQGAGGDLLELYCGNGNFTLPLSRHFRRVLATEVSKTSVAAAQWNIAHNQVDNIQIARLSAEEFTAAFSGCRTFRRLAESGIALADYDFSTIFIDPPRAGVDNATLQLVAQFDRIIYVSCNPETLAANLQTLTQTHAIQATALFDQFPFTPHIESGVLLTKKAA
nr:tRNA (uridine(54)-C5)-methyltransferase TrmA [uncultured Kingella sp.]